MKSITAIVGIPVLAICLSISVYNIASSAAMNAKNPNDVIIIAHPDLQESLSRQDIKRIFLNKRKLWDDNRVITFAMLKDNDVHTNFLRDFVHKTPSQYRCYFRRLVFTGKGRPPKMFDSRQRLVEFVSKNAGAIGYVPAGTDIGNARAIELEE